MAKALAVAAEPPSVGIGERPRPHLAHADGEERGAGPIAQPFNTLSSLAYVAAGISLLGQDHASTRTVGWAAIAAGLGSVAYHGPGAPTGRYLHDVGLIWLLGASAVDDLVKSGVVADQPLTRATPVLAATLGAHHRASPVIQVLAGGAAIAAAAGPRRSGPVGQPGLGRDLLGGALMLGGLALHVLGRSGGPLASPPRRVPGHAGWHVASAAAIALRSRRPS